MDQEPDSDNDAEAEFLAPDGTWGTIVVIICIGALAFLMFIPTREGGSPSWKWVLAGLTLIWMASGIRQIAAARAWKKRHRRPKDLTNR
jgi:hypothetical protein